MPPSDVVFLLDVDNTLLDNDAVEQDLRRHIEEAFGAECRDRYLADLRAAPGDAGVRRLPRRAAALPHRAPARAAPHPDLALPRRLPVPGSPVSGGARRRQPTPPAGGRPVILTDGDVVFQPRKVDRSGLLDAVEGRALIYIHKEQMLDDVARRYPARHYVMLDDKLRILSAMKSVWGSRLTTVFVRQGHYAHDPNELAAYPAADVKCREHRRPGPGRLPGVAGCAGPERRIVATAGRHRTPRRRILAAGVLQVRVGLEKDRDDESNSSAPRPRPESLARQHHARPSHDRHAEAVHRRAVGDRAHLESDDLRPARSRASRAYDDAIRQALGKGKSGEALFFDLALDDLTRAADLFRPIHDRTAGVDGWVSLEVSPLLAHDTGTTLAEAADLHARAGRPNLFIKIPGTKEGIPAIEEAIFAGVPINVTLLFSREHYLAAADAYLRGVERRIAAGLDPERRLGRLVVRQPLGRFGGGQGAGRRREHAGHRHGRADLQGVL